MRSEQSNEGPSSLVSWLSGAAACASVAFLHVMQFGLSPVGRGAADLGWTLLLAVYAAVVVPRAPLWTLVGAFLVVLGFASWPSGAILSLAGLAIVLVFWRTTPATTELAAAAPSSQTFVRNAAVAATSVCLFSATLSLDDHGISSASALVAGTVWLGLLVAAISRLPRKPKRIIFASSLALGALLVGFAALIAIELRGAYRDASAAEGALRRGAVAARAGDFASAETAVHDAARHVRAAGEPLASAPVSVLGYVPVASQNLEFANTTVDSADRILLAAEVAISNNPDDLITDAGVDVDRLAQLAHGAEGLIAEANRFRQQLEGPRSAWVHGSLTARVDSVAEQTEPFAGLGEVSLVDGVRRLLGDAQPRNYLVLFGNVAEARELGGFAGGTALVRVENGSVSLLRADRPHILNREPATPADFRTPPPQRFLEHRPWMFSQNFTAMSDFPTLAGALGDLYPVMSGGEEIDGVAYVDPRALSALVGLVGEVHLPQTDLTVRPEEVTRLVTVGQYAYGFETRRDREDFLGELIASTFAAVFESGSSLDLTKLKPLATAITQDRLLFAPFDDDEFVAMEALGLVGGVPEPDGQDYLAVSHLNAGPNKLDVYLNRTVNYDVTLDPITGTLQATAEITLRNEAPEDLPEYAAWNHYDYPDGTNRAIVVVHTPHDLVRWDGGDEPELTRSFAEFGYQRHEHVVVVPAGESRTISIELEGQVDPGGYGLTIGHQPLVTNDEFTLAISASSGRFEARSPHSSASGHLAGAQLTLKNDVQIAFDWQDDSSASLARAIGTD